MFAKNNGATIKFMIRSKLFIFDIEKRALPEPVPASKDFLSFDKRRTYKILG